MTIVSLHAANNPSGLELCRLRLGLSQREAARLTGVSRRRLRELEDDAVLTPASLRIALTYLALRVLTGQPFFDSNWKEAA
jgi:transcriptional regulator with XRE-family HTH domain